MTRPKLFVVVDPADARQIALERALITGPKQDPLPELYVFVGVDNESAN